MQTGAATQVPADSRFQSLTDALASARQDTARFNSVLMREGAAVALPLLDAADADSKAKLLDSLAELRRVVEQHQQADATVIFEEQ